MADRYWVGGTGFWTQTSHWSTSSGGSSGASYPTSTDNAFIDANSGGGVVLANGSSCNNLDCTGYTGQVSSDGGTSDVYGDLTLSSAAYFTLFSPRLVGSGAQSATFAGRTILGMDVVGGSSVRVVTFNSACTVSGDMFFNYGDGTNGGAAITLKLKNGATLSCASFSMATSGPSLSRNMLCSTSPGSSATISDTSGTNTLYYVNVQDITATGGATWSGSTHAYDLGNNSGISGLSAFQRIRGNLFGVVA